MSKEDFKNFVKNKPELADYVNKNEMTWQKFYELYDLYGDDNEIWNKYSKKPSKISDFMDKFDPDVLQEHIKNAQKALDIFSELATKKGEEVDNIIKPSIKKPIEKFFGD